MVNRRHHCRHCGSIFCKKCAGGRVLLPRLGYDTPQRACAVDVSRRRTGRGDTFARDEDEESDGGDGGGGERRRGVRRWDAAARAL